MRRAFGLAAASLAVFAAVAVLMLRWMPQPMKPSDYLVAGSVATLVAMLVLFLAMVSTGPKAKDVFFKRRKKRQ